MTRLEEAGFSSSARLAGMYTANLSLPMTLNPTVRVRKASMRDYDLVSEVYCEVFPFGRDVSDLLVELIDAVGGAHYLAYLGGVDKPVGAASMHYKRDQPIVVLEMAATLEAYRGQGVYRSLLARRLADAHADAMQVAVTQAFRATSQPILSKVGLVERCNITAHAWDPAGA